MKQRGQITRGGEGSRPFLLVLALRFRLRLRRCTPPPLQNQQKRGKPLRSPMNNTNQSQPKSVNTIA